MRALLAVLLLLALAFAGCSSKSGGGDDDGDGTGTGTASGTKTASGSKSGTGTSSSSGSSSGALVANRAPSAQIAASSMQGTSPLLVNLTVGGSDPDGDDLTWELSFGDGSANATGATLPATLMHNYTAGSFNATLVVSDGTLSSNQSLVIDVTAAAPRFSFSGSTTLTGSPASSGVVLSDTPGLGARACTGFLQGESGQDCVFTVMPATVVGGLYNITATVDSPDFEFWDSCDAAMGEAVQTFGGNLIGTVPAGVGCVVMWNFGSATGSFSIVVI